MNNEQEMYNVISRDIEVDSHGELVVKQNSFLGEFKENKFVVDLYKNKDELLKKYCFNTNIYANKTVKKELLKVIKKDGVKGNVEDYEKNFWDITSVIKNEMKVRSKIFENNIKNSYYELILVSNDEKELHENILKYILLNFEDYIDYLKTEENEKIVNNWDKLYFKGNYLKRIIGIDFIDIDISKVIENENMKNNIIENHENEYLISEFFEKYEVFKKKNPEKLNSENAMNITYNYKDRIIELYDLELSKRKIIDVISSDLWENGILERKVERSVRRRGETGKKELVDNKISKNVVDKIIKEHIENLNNSLVKL